MLPSPDDQHERLNILRDNNSSPPLLPFHPASKDPTAPI